MNVWTTRKRSLQNMPLRRIETDSRMEIYGRFQLLSGLYLVIFLAAASVSGPRSFS